LRPLNDLSPFSRNVTIIERTPYLCQDETSSARSLLMERLQAKGCSLITEAQVKSVEGDKLIWEKDGCESLISDVDMVIAAVGSIVDSTLKEQLELLGVKVHAIENTINIQAATYAAFRFVQRHL
jgi:pyruvate/2-oxoglutarate dehydrogenase complex dihydrolipoamide dehydrogenase (E3) component